MSFPCRPALRTFFARQHPSINRLDVLSPYRGYFVLFDHFPRCMGLYRDVWIAAIASSTTSLATRTAAICVRCQGRRVRRVYVTMEITFHTRISALIYRRGLRQRVASLTLNCNGVFAIRAYGDSRGASVASSQGPIWYATGVTRLRSCLACGEFCISLIVFCFFFLWLALAVLSPCTCVPTSMTDETEVFTVPSGRTSIGGLVQSDQWSI